MSDTAITVAAIDTEIAAREKKIGKLRPHLETLQRELDALIQSRAILAPAATKNGKESNVVLSNPPYTNGNSSRTIQALRDILLENGEMHVNEITKELNKRGIVASKAVVTTALARNAAKGRVFQRVPNKPNTFDLLGLGLIDEGE